MCALVASMREAKTLLLLAGLLVLSCEASSDLTCGPPELPHNGHVRGGVRTKYELGDVVEYVCDYGYEYGDESTIAVCVYGVEHRAHWNTPPSSCTIKPIDCLQLGDINKGAVIVTGLTPGSTAIYTCKYGYELIGSTVRVCQKSGEWSGSVPFCSRVKCGSLTSPRYGHIDLYSIRVGAVARYGCDSGYYLVGAETRMCLPDGVWSDYPPVCKPVDCGALDYPDRGAVTLSGTLLGSVASYYCTEGYTLVGGKERECLATGYWSGLTPMCVVIDCGYLPAPNNGVVELVTSTIFGSEAQYSCNEGYMLKGQYTRECGVAGMWSGEAPICEPIFCKKLHHPVNGLVRLVQADVGAKAMYECFRGYALVGGQYRMCQSSGEWSGIEPTCQYVDCGYLIAPEYAVVSQNGNDFGSKARYNCRSGYLLVGDEIRTCEANGQWSGYEPKCKFLGCDYLHPPQNGKIAITGVSLHSTATYSCNVGYSLTGKHHHVRKCRLNGEWSGSAPMCIQAAVECPYLGSPSNGHVTVSGTQIHSTALYNCNKGFALAGYERRECLPSGQWSGTEPICNPKPVPIKCSQLSYPPNGQVAQSGTSVGSVSTYSCESGYVLVGAQIRVCQADGSWSESEPHCELVYCPHLPEPSSGKVFYPSISLGSVATYSCDKGYILIGAHTRKCQASSQWSGKAPFCTKLDCGELESPRNGRVVLSGTTVNSKAIYNCDNKFTLVGDFTRLCQPDGTWSGNKPLCEFIDCGLLSDPENGQVVMTGTACESSAHYSCSDGFELIGDKTRICQSNAAWSGQPPFCRYIRCRELNSPTNGQVTLYGTAVGSTAKYDCELGYVLVGEETLTCLPNGQWSPKPPVCERDGIHANCGPPLSPKNGSVHVSCVTYGCRATYLCNNGFVLNGNRLRVCQGDSQWSRNTPDCKYSYQ